MADYIAGWYWLDVIVTGVLIFYTSGWILTNLRQTNWLLGFMHPAAIVLISGLVYWLNPDFSTFVLLALVTTTMLTRLLFKYYQYKEELKLEKASVIRYWLEAGTILLVSVPIISQLFLYGMEVNVSIAFVGMMIWATGQILYTISLWRRTKAEISNVCLMITWSGICIISLSGNFDFDTPILVSLIVTSLLLFSYDIKNHKLNLLIKKLTK